MRMNLKHQRTQCYYCSVLFKSSQLDIVEIFGESKKSFQIPFSLYFSIVKFQISKFQNFQIFKISISIFSETFHYQKKTLNWLCVFSL